MKVSSACLVLLTAGVDWVAAIEELSTVSVNRDDRILNPQNNRNGWVNPEDLAPMPQCIAQQDQSTWLSTMTRCTGKRCTRHFGVICTHHQWLTQLSCLSTGFSPDIVKMYLPYCGRSVLAKAQLYQWIRSITGRTWLVDVGDANGLERLSPTSLTEGYAAISETSKAPTCLTSSVFQNVMASCSFTSTTLHTGNAARPWEYSGSLRSMIALDFETVGYDLTGRTIAYGDYFDKGCFCSTFTMDTKQEPCSETGQIDLTRERLWMIATCGPTSVPDHWTDNLKTTEFAYIPTEDWHWPMCVTDMPKQVTELTDQCTTDACELDSSGYCKVKLRRAVDRACFCRNISYDSCGGSCHIFETRIDYVTWLHDLCGSVRDWHGLPDNWRQLAAPTTLDMIPWRWTVKSSNKSNTAPKAAGSPSNEWKLGSFALVNIATFLAAILSRRTGISRIARGILWHPHPWCWFPTGILIAVLQLLANWLNAFLVQKTLGYEDVPVIQLMLLWCSIPRLAWLTTLPIGVQPFGAMDISAATSSLFAETILQILPSYYMILTVNYGREHNFYLGGLKSAERGASANLMYAGALLWLIIITVGIIQFLLATRRMNRLTGSASPDLPKRQRSKQRTPKIAEDLISQLDQHFTRLWGNLVHHWMDKRSALEETSLLGSEGGNYTVYGTLPVKSQHKSVSRKVFANLYAITALSMPLLWIAQWLFWGGFIGLSSEEFCPPKLVVLTAVWIASSLAGAIVGAT